MERIGILCVHGIGEQRPGDTADECARFHAAALSTLGHDVVREVANRQPAMVRLRVSGGSLGRATTTIDIREVHWADIGYPGKLRDRMAFWAWAFSFWSHDRKKTAPLAGAAGLKKLHLGLGEVIAIRTKLFLAGYAVAVLGTTLSLLSQALAVVPFVGNWLRAVLKGSDVMTLVVSYVGDVKLYQENQERLIRFEGMPERPRVSIRRRIVAGLADMALGDYDRWYVMAHSLGSVVAFDGLMEVEQALPNYLDRDRAYRLYRHGIIVDGQTAVPAVQRPPRPDWMPDTWTMSRPALFARLGGFLTYGSPIDKFRTLWPSLTVVNPQPGVFPPGFEWHNVYEVADIVAGHIDRADISMACQGGGSGLPAPANHGTKRQGFVGFAHTDYWAEPKRPDSLAMATARWVVHQTPFQPPAFIRPGTDARAHRWSMWTQVVALVALVPALLALAIWCVAGANPAAILPDAPAWLNLPHTFLGWYGLILGIPAAVVLAAALCRD